MIEFIGWIDSEHNIILDHNQEIVRCRDCKHWATEARWCGYCVGRKFDPDGFCKWGERKDE